LILSNTGYLGPHAARVAHLEAVGLAVAVRVRLAEAVPEKDIEEIQKTCRAGKRKAKIEKDTYRSGE
jgi:hypothetical protein